MTRAPQSLLSVSLVFLTPAALAAQDTPENNEQEKAQERLRGCHPRSTGRSISMLASTSEIHGKVSAVGERTYGSVPAAFGEDVSSFGPEDLFVGWRSGKALTIGENALDFSSTAPLKEVFESELNAAFEQAENRMRTIEAIRVARWEIEPCSSSLPLAATPSSGGRNP
jgi:hypothetical protein